MAQVALPFFVHSYLSYKTASVKSSIYKILTLFTYADLYYLIPAALGMGSLASETDSLNYLRLGLKGSGKGNSGKPRVLSILSMLLESSVQENEKFLETSEAKDVITIFHGSRAPSLSIQQYVDRIFKYACCSPSCFVVAHIYMEKFIQCTNACLTSFNVHRLLITSVMVAAKFIDDS